MATCSSILAREISGQRSLETYSALGGEGVIHELATKLTT